MCSQQAGRCELESLKRIPFTIIAPVAIASRTTGTLVTLAFV
jgi:hypothetical protein